jgi:hypothetical protein
MEQNLLKKMKKLIVVPQLKKIPAFYVEPKGSLSFSQEPAIGPY